MHNSVNIITKTRIRNHLLWIADLMEAHFIVEQYAQDQMQAIQMARDIAQDDAFMPPKGMALMHELFERLRVLKSHQMVSSRGIAWRDLVREDILNLAREYQNFMRDHKSHAEVAEPLMDTDSYGFPVSADRHKLKRRRRQQLMRLPFGE